MAQTYIFVSGGVITDALDKNANPLPDLCIVDYDLIEGGECPVCWADFREDDPICPRCGFSRDDKTAQGAIAASLRLEALKDKESSHA